jgi:Erythromycin esterase
MAQDKLLEIRAVRENARPVTGSRYDYDPLIELAGNSRRRLERAIGVIYLPESERVSHYFNAQLPGQFDGVIHLDTTRAVEPLERTSQWETGELPETYPFRGVSFDVAGLALKVSVPSDLLAACVPASGTC